MIKHGRAPYLECSSGGDKRFSAHYARVKSRGSRTIEEVYQSSKVFAGGVTNLSVAQAYGKAPINRMETRQLYSTLWDEYICDRPDLLKILRAVSGLRDSYGRPGHMCQATELWRIRNSSFMSADVRCYDCGLVMEPRSVYMDKNGTDHVCGDCWLAQSRLDGNLFHEAQLASKG